MAFQVDIFSPFTPSWFTVSSSKYHQILDILSYFISVEKVTAIQQVGSLEINSSNFRVLCSDHTRHVLKLSDPNSLNHDSTLFLQRYLSDHSCPVLLPTPTKHGELYLLHNNKICLLYPYAEGNYYSGDPQLLPALASGIGHLSSALKSYSRSSSFPPHPSLFTDVNATLIDHLPHILNDRQFSGLESFPCCLDKIITTYNHLSCLDLYTNSQLVHIDLHPHNILFKDTQIQAFLDWDSLAVAPVEISFSFAILKLCRQSICNYPDTPNYQSLSALFIENLTSTYPYPFHAASLRYFAQSEVLRRIFLILDLSHNSNDSSWNHVLPTQLSHLDEIDIILPA